MANKAAVPALEVRELSFRYGNRPALNRASLSVAPGVVCGLLGPNGSGKTTLFKCCLNFLRAAEGEVRVDGRPRARLSPAALARLNALREEIAQPQPRAFVPVPEAALGVWRAADGGAAWSEIEIRRTPGGMGLSLVLRGARIDLELGLDGVRRLSRWHDPEGRAYASCGWGQWSGSRFFGRVTFFPDIPTLTLDIERTPQGLTAWIQTNWVPPIGEGRPQKFRRQA